MYVILASLNWQFDLVSLHDTEILPKTSDKRIDHVKQVLILQKRVEATLKLIIYLSFTHTIDYSGQVAPPRHTRIALETAEKITNLRQPCSITKMRSFLGHCSGFRRFSSSFAGIAVHLNSKFQNNQNMESGLLDEKELAAMTTFQETNFSFHSRVAIRCRAFGAEHRHMHCLSRLPTIAKQTRHHKTANFLVVALIIKAETVF